MKIHTIVERIAIIAIFLGLLSPGRFPSTSADQTDISCLKSLKDSIQDPFGSISTWNFTTTAEGFICKFNGIDCWNLGENRVISIRLNDMGLMGQFPAGLEKCTSLQDLYLSNNQLSGPIPSHIWPKLAYLVVLDLSNNHFSGLIPPSIASCVYINSLSLNNNSLSGAIPSELGLLQRITTFTVANNMLTGQVPDFSAATSIELNYENNHGLCGGPLLKACCGGPLLKACNDDFQFYFYRGFIIGGAVSASLVFFVCLFAIPGTAVKELIHQMDRKKKRQAYRANLWPINKETSNAHRITMLDKYVTRIPFKELTNATGNFSQENVIGQVGKMGRMYKATIKNQCILAVKWLIVSEQLDRQIASEILSLGRIKHRRLVPLIGFCLEKNDTFLVYKYMSNGNLYDWLHPREGEGEIIRYWLLRIKIAVGVAEGLAWLHQNFGLIHGAISSKCVLLDKNFEPKLSNFWEAKINKSKDSTSSWSFFQSGDFQEELDYDKRDVYCFGIMLLELITGKKPEELASSIRNLGPASLSAYTSSVFKVDETLIGQGFDDEIQQCLQVAKNCLHSNPGQRPSMVQVYETLVAFAHIQNGTSDFEISFS